MKFSFLLLVLLSLVSCEKDELQGIAGNVSKSGSEWNMNTTQLSPFEYYEVTAKVVYQDYTGKMIDGNLSSNYTNLQFVKKNSSDEFGTLISFNTSGCTNIVTINTNRYSDKVKSITIVNKVFKKCQ